MNVIKFGVLSALLALIISQSARAERYNAEQRVFWLRAQSWPLPPLRNWDRK